MNEKNEYYDDEKPKNQAYYDDILGAWVPAGSDTSNYLETNPLPNVSPLYGQSNQEITKANNSEAGTKKPDYNQPSLS